MDGDGPYGIILQMRWVFLLLAVAAVRSVAGVTPAPVLRTVAEIRALTDAEFAQGRAVELEVSVVASLHSGSNGVTRLIVRDATGGFVFEDIHGPAPVVGDLITAKGYTYFNSDIQQTSVHSLGFVWRGQRPPPEPKVVALDKISDGREDFNLVRLQGFVSEVETDEINPAWNYLILRKADKMAYVSIPLDDLTHEDLNRIVDSEVELTGIVLPHYAGERMFVGPHLELWGRSCIRELQPSPEDPFESPYFEDVVHASPTELVKMRRRRVEGLVLATWGGDRCLVREDSGRLMGIELSPDEECPKVDSHVAAVGFPRTDLFRLKLSRALCRTVRENASQIRERPEKANAAQILLDGNGRRQLNQKFFGKTIQLRGIVRNLPTRGEATERINLDSDGFLVPVDLCASPNIAEGLAIGCELEVSGVCIMEAENWRTDNLFPVLGGFTLVPRDVSDIRVLSRPSWWTPGRLLIVIGSLLAALVGVFVWNRMLNRLVERRSRQLFREQVAHAGADLRVGERTRLAVELHDSLSQTLTGVSFQIDAAERARRKDPTRIEKHLAIAKRTLLACREELRNCLWDLRNNALEETDPVEAIRKTVTPHIGEAELSIDFGVQRERISDNTFHALLCIFRELSTNAVRHGGAKRVGIRGERAGDRLEFSVTDDGCGFAPEERPGMDEGHFGLMGVAERIEMLGGEMELTSAPGRGTVVRFAFEI